MSTVPDSSLWQEPLHVRIVFLTMVAKKDFRTHVYHGNIHRLRRHANVSEEQVREAVKILESPDPDSFSKVEEGRRIKPVEGGWLIINGAEYRKRIRSIAHAEAQGRYRAAKAGGQAPSPETPVTLPKGFPKTEAEAFAACGAAGIPRDFVVTTWNQAMSRNGADSKGQPIVRFAHHVAAMWRYQQERNSKAEGEKNHTSEPGKLSDAELLRRAMS